MIKNLGDTKANRELVTTMVDEVFAKGNFDAAPMFISYETYY